MPRSSVLSTRASAWRHAVTGLALSAASIGCSSPPPPAETGRECSVAQAIVGGEDAEAPRWSAVGSLGTLAGGVFAPLCSATLVAPTVVLTAKHCYSPLAARAATADDHAIQFALGANGGMPSRMVAVSAGERLPPQEGGYTGLGSDLALYDLVTAIVEVVPMPLAPSTMTEADIGNSFVAVGFGVPRTRIDRRNTRGLAPQTVRALRGNLVKMIFGTLDDCRSGRARIATYSTVCPLPVEDYWCDVVDSTDLLSGYEVWAGASDAQTCSGDSGGPLVMTGPESPVPHVVGVTSWGWASLAGDCAYGTVFALITDEARSAVVQRAR